MISSRTPEGSPNQCPICGHDVRIEPSILSNDAPCSSCGHLLWFELGQPHFARFAQYDSLVQILAEQLNVSVDELKKDPDLLQRLEDADSLDTVELVMELEENET